MPCYLACKCYIFCSFAGLAVFQYMLMLFVVPRMLGREQAGKLGLGNCSPTYYMLTE